MAISIWNVSITDTPIELPRANFTAAAGGVVDFFGIVRALEGERKIEGIEYEANRAMAEHQLTAIAQQAAAEFDLAQIFITHRIGFIRVAEASLFLRVASQHRSSAFSASMWTIDQLKQRVAIWKRPVFADRHNNKQTLENVAGR